MSKPQTEAEKLAEIIDREEHYYDTGSHYELSSTDAAAAILAAGYGDIAEAAHKARRETLAEVQAHVRDELEKVQPGGRSPRIIRYRPEGYQLAALDGHLANLQIEHARQDPEGRALAEGILERKAASPPEHTLWCRGGNHEGHCRRGRAAGTEQ